MRVLIAFPKREVDLAEEVRYQLRQAARQGRVRMKPPLVEHDVASAIDTFKEERGAFSHLIIHDRLPSARTAPPSAGAWVALADSLRGIRNDMSIALMSTRKNPKWSQPEIAAIGRNATQLISNSAMDIEKLKTIVFDARRSTAVINIVIDFSQSDLNFQYTITRNDQISAPKQDTVHLRPNDLLNLRDLSMQLEKSDDWSVTMPRLRGDLYSSLLCADQRFLDALSACVSESTAGDVQEYDIRVCFRLDEKKFDVAFDAIRHPETNDYWMLHAPVVRSFENPSRRNGASAPVFDGRNNRFERCLLILSEAKGNCVFVDDKDKPICEAEFSELDHARQECDELEKYLNSMKATHKVGFVDSIGFKEKLTSRRLEDALNESWDLIHYIGHTDFQGNDGFLILPGERDDEARSLRVSDIAPKLRKTPFIYLSSCKGSKAAFVRRLAEQHVPCTLGFRARVPDQFALDHAKCFYERLFEVSSIEQALLQTRQKLKEGRPERLWACPSLVVQMH